MSRTEIGVHVAFGVSRQRLGPQEGSGGGPQDQGVQLRLLFCFPGDDKGARVTVLLGRERGTGVTVASVVPVNGTSWQQCVCPISSGNAALQKLRSL